MVVLHDRGSKRSLTETAPEEKSFQLESWRAANARAADHGALNAPEAVRGLYRIMQKHEKILGGGEGVVGVYGTITLNGMHTIMQSLKRECGLAKESLLVDVGSGLARPLLHALVDPGVSGAWGIELDNIKCDKAAALIDRTTEESDSKHVCTLRVSPKITCTPVEKVDTFYPYSHAFSFWEGVPQNGKHAFGRTFRKTDSMRGVAVVQRAFRKDPETEMRRMGFGILALVDMIRVKMSGSGRSFVAYIFKKPEHPPPSVLEVLAAERLLAQENEMALSKRRKTWTDSPESTLQKPIAQGTRSKKKIDWARRRDIRNIGADMNIHS